MNVVNRLYLSLFLNYTSYFSILYLIVPLFKHDYTQNEFFYTKLAASACFTFRYAVPGFIGGNFIDSFYKRYPVLVSGLLISGFGSILSAVFSTIIELQDKKWPGFYYIGSFVGILIASFANGFTSPIFYTAVAENTLARQSSQKHTAHIYYAVVTTGIFVSLFLNFILPVMIRVDAPTSMLRHTHHTVNFGYHLRWLLPKNYLIMSENRVCR